MVMEIMGRREDTRTDDGFRHWNLLRHRKKAEEKINAGLFMGKFTISQLVGLQILFVRTAGLN